MKQIKIVAIILFLILAPCSLSFAGSEETFLVHLKTSLKKDDAQICVAYNMIWAALKKGYKVNVLVDADAINTFKKGWRGKDDIENYDIPESLRKEMASQFNITLNNTPETYGNYLKLLKNEGAEFYVNKAYLIVAKIGTPDDPLSKVSMKFFKPITLQEMVDIRTSATYYMAY